MGIVLDIQQLFTATKNLARGLGKIPPDSLKGFHIHYRRRIPTLCNSIPWRKAFDKIVEVPNDVIINPEVHHNKWVKKTIGF